MNAEAKALMTAAAQACLRGDPDAVERTEVALETLRRQKTMGALPELQGAPTDEEQARAKAIELYPQAPLSRVKDHGRAEAILIARHWQERSSASPD